VKGQLILDLTDKCDDCEAENMTEGVHPTFRPPAQGEKVKARILDFELTKGGTTEYTLEDGTVVRLTPQLNQVLMQVDEKGDPILGPQGIPIYNFNFGIQTQVIPKNRTLYVPKPSHPPGTPPSSMTV